MPGMDGIDVCRRVKRDPNHPFTYVVMLTSRDAQEDMVAGLDAGRRRLPHQADRARRAAQPHRGRRADREARAAQGMGDAAHRGLRRQADARQGRVRHRLGSASTNRPAKTVALKIIRVDLATDEVFGRFAREIELMEKLDHPNIARIYDSRIDKTLGYYSMELVGGGTLEEYVRRKTPEAGRW